MEHDAPGERSRRSHRIDVTTSPRLREILGEDTVSVNSFHHQSVDRVGQGLAVSARCPDDGVIEGLEMPGRRFVIAVQWHPESFWSRPASFQPLFDAHVYACRGAALAGLRRPAGSRRGGEVVGR
jgi:putative glutamine amidotransferase